MEKRGPFDQDGEWSCEELHGESQMWLHAFAWGPEVESSEDRAEDAKRERARIASWLAELCELC
jgi:hypothetical protein